MFPMRTAFSHRQPRPYYIVAAFAIRLLGIPIDPEQPDWQVLLPLRLASVLLGTLTTGRHLRHGPLRFAWRPGRGTYRASRRARRRFGAGPPIHHGQRGQ